MIKKITLLFILVIGLTPSKAQINPSQVLSGSAADIDYLANGYLAPLGNVVAEGLNSGWYSTAKTHNLGRFDLMVTTAVILVPDAQQMFTINNSELDQLQLVSGATAESATVFGDKGNGPGLEYKNTPGLANFNTPGGTGYGIFGLPMARLSVGLIKNTEVSVRYLPEITFPRLDDAKLNVLGFGVKHDILQWIPGGKLLPFSVSGFFGYTNVDYTQSLGEDQEFSMNSTGYTLRALVSKNFLFITPYVGVGINGGSTEMKISGTFDNPLPLGSDFVDPVNITTEDAGGFVGNVGIRLKFLLVVAITADYTFGAYEVFTTGLGISIDL